MPARKPKPKLSEAELAKRKVTRTQRQNKVTMHGTLWTNRDIVKKGKQISRLRKERLFGNIPGEYVRIDRHLAKWSRYTLFVLRSLHITGPTRREILAEMRNYAFLELAGIIVSKTKPVPEAKAHLKAGRAETIDRIDEILGEKSTAFWEMIRDLKQEKRSKTKLD